MLKAVKMASVKGTHCVCVCVLRISLCSIVTKEAATVSYAQIWASICFGAACKNYLCESLRGQIRGYRKEMFLLRDRPLFLRGENYMKTTC